jgi:hypothetical protein
MSVASFPRIREDFVFVNSIILQGRNISERGETGMRSIVGWLYMAVFNI